MPYAINGSTIRAINNESDLRDGEVYSVGVPDVWPPEPSNDEKLIALKVKVQEALYKSDLVALRAYKSGIAFGYAWAKYDSDLRALLSVSEWSDDLALPPKPEAYPS